MERFAGGRNVTNVTHFILKNLKLICFAYLFLTLFFNLTFCIYPHSGIEVAVT